MKKALLIIGIVIITLAGCHSKKPAENRREQKIPVRITRIERKSLSLPISGTGILSAMEESKLSFKIGGIVDQLLVKEGDQVHRGQLLASLKLDEIQARASQARSGFEKASRDYLRARNLYADSVATLEQMQDAKTGMEVAKAQLEIAEFNLKHAKIVSPENGKILKRLVERNEMIGAGYPVYLFGSGQKNWVLKVGLSDRDVVRCQPNDSAIVKVDVYPDQSFTARIQEIAGAPDPMSGLYEVQLKLDPVNVSLMTGFVCRMVLYPSDRTIYTLIPMVSLVNGNDHSGEIFTVSDSQAARIPVKIAFINGEKVALKDSLENIDVIITEGASYLKNGSPVEIISN
ncbi:efflux RND transporter periplasmic adaptor subunit [bacterium]|nr:efflux RND transporter periplasmic adaptor subunit [bacterium]